MQKNTKSLDHAFPIELPSLSPFFQVSPVILLDSRVSPRHLKVYLCLAAHYSVAKARVTVTRERIAKMCGFMSGGKPDVRLVSKLIDATPAVQEQLGPGLVQLGYVKKTVKGLLQCNDYELTFPTLKDAESFQLQTESGETVQLRDPRVVPLADRPDKPIIKSKSDKLAEQAIAQQQQEDHPPASQDELDFDRLDREERRAAARALAFGPGPYDDDEIFAK